MHFPYPLKSLASTDRPPPLRAVVEIVDGELKIFPIAETDEQAAAIVDAIAARMAGGQAA